ncbi:MAG: MBL fold metallo-hydrolase [Spirochaetota bacterium]
MMKITFLGSGTSHGVPVIGCNCPVCTSTNPKNNRTRASIWVRNENTSVLVDTSTDFRTQAIREGLSTLDAIFFTHAHADHLHGLDDIRPISKNITIPVYGNQRTLEELKFRFDYVFKETQRGGGKPKIELHELTGSTVIIGSIKVTPIPIKHGILDILGFRFGNAAYLTDCSFIPESSLVLLKDLDVLLIGALRIKPHETHFSISQAIETANVLKPAMTYLTHLCHNVEHETLSKELPGNIQPAWDGLSVEL